MDTFLNAQIFEGTTSKARVVVPTNGGDFHTVRRAFCKELAQTNSNVRLVFHGIHKRAVSVVVHKAQQVLVATQF